MPKNVGAGDVGAVGSAAEAFALGSNPIGWAILGVYAAWKIGSGIYNIAKGRKMEKQAVKDRETYINTMSDWVLWGQEQQRKAAQSGLDFAKTLRSEAEGYSQYNRPMIQQNLSDYSTTASNVVSKRISEQNLMKKKFGLGG